LGIRVITKYATKYVLVEYIMRPSSRPSCLKDVVPKSNRVSSQIEIECDIAAIDIAPIITTTILRSVKRLSVELLLFLDDVA